MNAAFSVAPGSVCALIEAQPEPPTRCRRTAGGVALRFGAAWHELPAPRGALPRLAAVQELLVVELAADGAPSRHRVLKIEG